MKADEQRRSSEVEVFALIDASIRELIEAIEDDAVLAEEEGALPARADQIADLILDETVRLIRLGGRSETVEAGAELADALIGPKADQLEDGHGEAFLSMIGASRVLQAASSPSSRGSEITVLNSWKGKALKVLVALHDTPDEEMPRAEIRSLLGNLKESHLSHLLADMEAAGLVVRVREGRMVTVHLGAAGRSKRVREMLPQKTPTPTWSSSRARSFFWHPTTFEKNVSFAPLHFIFDQSRLQESEFHGVSHEFDLTTREYEPAGERELGEAARSLFDKQFERQIRSEEIPGFYNSGK